jgi:hypothetical protein
MSFGVALRNAVAIGLGGIITLFSGNINAEEPAINGVLLCENGDRLVQEDGGLILLEP